MANAKVENELQEPKRVGDADEPEAAARLRAFARTHAAAVLAGHKSSASDDPAHAKEPASRSSKTTKGG